MTILDPMRHRNRPLTIIRATCGYCSSNNTNTRTGTCNDCHTTNPGIGSQTRRMRRNAVSSKDSIGLDKPV